MSENENTVVVETVVEEKKARNIKKHKDLKTADRVYAGYMRDISPDSKGIEKKRRDKIAQDLAAANELLASGVHKNPAGLLVPMGQVFKTKLASRICELERKMAQYHKYTDEEMANAVRVISNFRGVDFARFKLLGVPDRVLSIAFPGSYPPYPVA